MDPITCEVVRGALTSAAEDMRSALVRSAHSPVIYEAHDCSVGLYNEQAETLGQAPGLPFFTGSLDGTLRQIQRSLGPSAFGPGDVFVINDPYVTGSHLNDVTVISAVVFGGEIVGFAACMAHWEDVGSAAGTLSVMSTEVYEEGLRLGPVRVMQAGEPVSDMIDVLRRNTRYPDAMLGDLSAQIAACRIGERRYVQLIERFGLDRLRSAVATIFDTTELLERQAIASIPDDVYSAEAVGDASPTEPNPLEVKVRVTVSGSELILDTRGSSGLRADCTNTGINQSVSGLRLAYKFLIRPDIGVTGGSFRSLDMRFDVPSCFAATEPAACFGYGSAPALAIDLFIRALAPAIPDRVTAGGPGSSWNVAISGRRPGGTGFGFVEALAGGWGACAVDDGDSATIHMDAGDFRNTPVEIAESRYPIKVCRYGLLPDSGGPGRTRGGLGVFKEYEALVGDCRLSAMFGRRTTPSWGLFEGRDGSIPDVVLDIEGKLLSMPVAANVALPRGALLRAQTGGGGGYGPPWERPMEMVLNDVLDGYVSERQAFEEYGVVVIGHPPTIDQERTRRRRLQLARMERDRADAHRPREDT